MKYCIECGVRARVAKGPVCIECRAELLAAKKHDDEHGPVADCDRPHPWPACRCLACEAAIDAAFGEAAKLHKLLAEKGRQVHQPASGMFKRSKVPGARYHLQMLIPPDELELLEMASTLSAMPMKQWARRAIRRQAWLETHGEAALVARVDDLTRAVSLLLQKVETLCARPPSDPPLPPR